MAEPPMSCNEPPIQEPTGLAESYRHIKRCIVAFVASNAPERVGIDGRPGLRPIIGTGFVLREDGVIVTNDHVVRLFPRLPADPTGASPTDWPVHALLFWEVDKLGVLQVPLPVIGIGIPDVEAPKGVFYGPKRPDIALVHVKGTGLPAVDLASEFLPREGIQVATAGFPMGTDALMAGGWLEQMTPTLQQGIISAVLPFACPRPHAYTINIMVQGGASGSPVFLPENGKVVGLLCARLREPVQIGEDGIAYMPTNVSYVLTGDNIRKALNLVANNPNFKPPKDSLPIQQILHDVDLHNCFDGRLYRYKDLKGRDATPEPGAS